MFKNLRKLFRRGKQASPHDTTKTNVTDDGVIHITDEEWERRRFELMKMLIAQERRSVVLGKLQANNRQIAETARRLTDASIAELINHPYREDYDTGKPKDG